MPFTLKTSQKKHDKTDSCEHQEHGGDVNCMMSICTMLFLSIMHGCVCVCVRVCVERGGWGMGRGGG